MIQYIVKSKKNPVSGNVKYYPQIAPTTPTKLQNISDQIEKMCTVSSSDIKAVLDALETTISSALKNGESVRLGDLGSFRPTLSVSGEAKAEDVTANNIKRVRVRFTPGGSFARRMAKENVQFRVYTLPTTAAGASA